MLKKLTIFICILVFNIFAVSYIHAEGTFISGNTSNSCPSIISYNSTTGEYKKISVSEVYGQYAQVQNNDTNNPSTETYYVNGVAYSRNMLLSSVAKETANLSCPPTIGGLQTLFLHIIVIVNSIIGLVLFYVIAKAGIIRMTARSNPDAIKKSNGMIMSAIIGLIIVLVAYVGLVLLGTRLLAPDSCTRFSFVESGKILFSFDQSDISPTLITDGSEPNCSTPVLTQTQASCPVQNADPITNCTTCKTGFTKNSSKTLSGVFTCD